MIMHIYIEYAILDNLVVNALLLWFMMRHVRCRGRGFYKIALCVVIGTVFAVAVPLISMGLLSYFNPGNFAVAVGLLMSVKVLVTVVFIFVLTKLIKFITAREAAVKFVRDVVITHGQKTFRVKGFVDTGNRLVDPDGEVPVVVISRDLYLKMFPVHNFHFVSFATVAGRAQSKMMVFTPEKFEVIGKGEENVRIGVSMRRFGGAIKYDALLSANFA